METNVIIANAFGLVSFAIAAIAYHRKEKNKMFLTTAIANFLKLVNYMILGAYSGVMTKIIAIVRDFAIIKQDKYKFLRSNIVLLLFVFAYIVFGVATYNGIISIFSLLAALIYTIFCWNGNEDTVRTMVVTTEILWLIYNAYVKLYVGCIYSVIMIVSTIVAIIRNKKGERKK